MNIFMLVNFHGTSPTHTRLTHTHAHTHKNQPQNTWNSPLLQLNTSWILLSPHSPTLLLPLLKMDTTQGWSFICSDGLLLSFVGFVSFSANSCYLPQLLLLLFLLLLLMLWLLLCVVQIDYRYKCQILERKNANARVYKSQSPAAAPLRFPT